MTHVTMPRIAADISTSMADVELGEMMRRITRPMIRTLARGETIAVDQLAAESGMGTATLQAALAGLPDVEWGADGRIVGFGLTPQPTSDLMEIADRTLYAWCAFDTLLFAALLERPVTIRSYDRSDRRTITVEIADNRVVRVEPQTTVVSWVGQKQAHELATLRDTYCRNIHFFASADAAAPWLAAHPAGSIESVTEAYLASRQLAAQFFAAADEDAPVLTPDATDCAEGC